MIDPILLNDFKRQWADVGPDVHQALERVGASGWYILGQRVAAFETALASYTKRSHAVGCASGLDAIEIALRAMGLQPGELVLTTPLSAFATTLAIVRAGGVPIFVDVDESGLLDARAARACLRSNPQIRFLLPVHLYGSACDLNELEALKRDFELNVIEDCAQAIGAEWRGRSVGSVGQLSTLSFYPTKNLGAFGDGGALVGDDKALVAACRSLRDYGQSKKYVHERLGLNSRLDELHAAVLGDVLLPKLDGWVARRREIAARYTRALSAVGVRTLAPPDAAGSVWHLFPVLVEAARRDDFATSLLAAGVHSAVHYPALIPDQPALRGHGRYHVYGTLETGKRLSQQELSLPIHPYLTDGDANRVIEAVQTWAQR